ncbi:MAG: 6-hydroxymethylpterin diphosphokinase MptE-like protein [Thiohalomonadales bacterium]
MVKQTQAKSLGEFHTNQFGDQYLLLINGKTFESSSSASVFSRQYEHLFEPNKLHIIVGTDSGLLPKWINQVGVPEGSHYVFAELPEVIQRLDMHATIGKQSRFDIITVDKIKEFLESPIAERFMFHDNISLHRSQAVKNAVYLEYQTVWRQVNSIFEQFIWTIKNTYTVHTRTNIQLKNIADNQVSAAKLKNKFCGKTAVLLAGGPSLDTHVKWIKKNRGKVLIAAVSRICRFLIANNITPDIIVSVDPYPYNLVVSKDIHAFQDHTLLVNGHYLNPELLSLWQGRKAHIGLCYPWKTKKEPDSIDLGCPTVTNSTYLLLLEMGFQQIILLGVDFCFSPNGYTHAKESTESDAGPMPMIGIFQTITNSGKSADTINQYLQAAEELRKMADVAAKRGCSTINPSVDAMKLDNIVHSSLEALVIEPLSEPAATTIQQYIPLSNHKNRNHHYNEVTKEIDFMLVELALISKLASQALSYNDKIYTASTKPDELKYKKKMDYIEEIVNSKHANASDFIKRYRIQNFIAIIRENTDIARTRKEEELAGRTYYQAYLKTINELLGVLNMARTDVLLRLEEENETKNLDQLLHRWETDQQFCRALQWKSNHRQLVQESSNDIQERFLNLEKQQELKLLDMEGHLTASIENRTNLDGIHAKAAEYLLQKNIDGLRSICRALGLHHDKDKIKHLKKITEAYLLELNEAGADAKSCYESMLEGPFKFEALKRLLSLHMANNDKSLTMQTLAQLAEISSTFIPPLAEMLSLMNETEQAINLFTDYLLLTPDDLQSMFKLGKLYSQLGSQEGAAWAMNYILEKDPDHEPAKKLLAEAS